MRVHIEKLVFGGQALARLEDGKTAFVWNALPGESVEMDVLERKRGIVQGLATEILEPSPDRLEPREASYLSTSPWQIMTPEAEDRAKLDIAKETYQRLGGFTVPELGYVTNPEQQYGYRNKMEFSFYTRDKDAPIELCFFARASSRKVPVEGSLLAEPVINEVAQAVVAWLNAEGVNRLDLKSLIVRSNGKGEAIAALFVKRPLDIATYPERFASWRGFHIYASNPKSPASVPTALLYQEGEETLTATLAGTELQFGLLSFFQVNLPVFAQALQEIRAWVLPGLPLVDMYAGVGSIGLPLRDVASRVVSVESNEEASQFAQANAKRAQSTNVDIVWTPAEQATDYIQEEQTLIVDPPRAGLHPDVVRAIQAHPPRRLVYLSCNLSTQARDVQQLLPQYQIAHASLLNFFPRTPHIEGLLVLDRLS